MKALFPLFCAVLTFSGLYAQKIIVQDNFTDRSKFTDNSKLVLWGADPDSVTVFELTNKTDGSALSYPCLALKPDVTGFYFGYNAAQKLRTSSFVDYTFTPINRKETTITVEFDAVWQRLDNVFGEGGRLVLTLLHDYPEKGLRFGLIDSTHLEAPFGRPAYNLRILNPSSTTVDRSGAFLVYGGGYDSNGEFEKYTSTENITWWLPGFSSEAGGTPPGLAENYPAGPTLKQLNDHIATDLKWMHYKWVIEPEYMKLYVRESAQHSAQERLYFTMATPNNDKTEQEKIDFMNDFHNTAIETLPTLYNWFGTIEGVRVYYRGLDNTYLANFKVTTDEETTTGISKIKSSAADITVFPTLVTDGKVNINVPNDEAYTVQIYDVQGRKYYSFTKKGNAELQIHELKQGLYLCMVEYEGKKQTVKIVVP